MGRRLGVAGLQLIKDPNDADKNFKKLDQMKFPVYERFGEGEILKNLGELKVQKSIREWKV